MPDALDVFPAYYATISAIEWPLSSKPEERFGSSGAYRIGLRPFRFVGCLPSTTDMSARHRRMRAGVVQTPMEETAECSGAA
jgi:hypothetical protein